PRAKPIQRGFIIVFQVFFTLIRFFHILNSSCSDLAHLILRHAVCECPSGQGKCDEGNRDNRLAHTSLTFQTVCLNPEGPNAKVALERKSPRSGLSLGVAREPYRRLASKLHLSYRERSS